MSLLSMMLGHPMQITRAGLDLMMAIAARESITPAMLEQFPGRRHSDEKPDFSTYLSNMTVNGDVGIIPVQGPIFRHATLFRQISGATTTEQIARDLGQARTDPQIKSVVMKFNTPGGEAASIGELAGMIRELDGVKPVTGFGDFLVGSAGYYLFAACGRRVAFPASFVGSIGTISAWTSTKKMKESLGLQDMVVVSPQTPKKGIDPESAEGLAELQAHLRFLSDHFIEDVARFTGHSRKRVMEDFGQGALVNADDALKAGMIDSFGTMESVIAAVSGGRKFKVSKPNSVAASGSGLMAKKTWGEVLFGSRASEEAPDAFQGDPPADSSPPSRQGDDGEKARLRAELAEERRLRTEAEEKARTADASAEDRRIQDKVRSWVQSGRINPAKAAQELIFCRALAKADSVLQLTGENSLLAHHEPFMDSMKDTGVCREEVPSNRDVTAAGGTIFRPPAGPGPATADQAAQDQADRQSVRNSPYARSGSNGTG